MGFRSALVIGSTGYSCLSFGGWTSTREATQVGLVLGTRVEELFPKNKKDSPEPPKAVLINPPG